MADGVTVATKEAEAVVAWLTECGLGKYIESIVNDQGYDDMEVLLSLSLNEIKELADQISMKPSDAIEFYLRQTAAKAAQGQSRTG
mmetsp:Transcript_68236/g.158357  ORF Transcript_68236/g.158357 Transcript_68236/m.158357 type:complete len:86 (+) Transcript_68236:61-318(+)